LWCAVIKETGMMPEYYSLEERDSYDPLIIAKQMLDYSSQKDEQEKWLEELYNSKMIIKDIYRYLFAFKKTIFDTLKNQKESELVTVDERQVYNIVPECYNLNKLTEEVLKMYPKLNTTGLLRVSWSRKVVRSYLGICQRYPDGTYQIRINILLSSPDIDTEIIKYVLFHELLHKNGYWYHNDDFRFREWQYPNSVELDAKLDSLHLKYNLDEIWGESLFDEQTENTVSVDNNSEPIFNPNAKGVQIGFKYCRNCGNKLPDTSKFCDKCGCSLTY